MVTGWFKRSTQQHRPAVGVAPGPGDDVPDPLDADNAGSDGFPPSLDIPAEKVHQRAYEKWVAAGCPNGTAEQDWLDAEAELRAELQGRPAEPLPHKSR